MKRGIGLFAVVAAVILGACSGPATQVESTLTADEVYDLAIERASHFHSATIAITLEQTKSTNADEQMLIKADLTGEAIEKPLKIHQAGKVSLHYPPLGMIDLDIELYAADDSIYIHENMFDHWIKASMDDLLDFGIQLNDKRSLFTFLEQVDTYIDDFTMEQTNDTFIFTLKSTTEQFQRHIIEEMRFFKRLNSTGAQKMDENDVDHTEQVDFSFTIDKETYHILSFDIEVHTEMTENEEATTVTTSIGVEFSNMNEVEDITVPKEVIDEATEEHPFSFQ